MVEATASRSGVAIYSLDDAIRDRRSVRLFRDEPVPRPVVEELLRLAVWAPSPHNSQPWRFTCLFDRIERCRLAQSMAERLELELTGDGQSRVEIERQTLRSRRRIENAPLVILCSLEAEGLLPQPDERRDALEWQMAVQSVGAVLQTLFLAAGERGIGSCWMAAPMYCPEAVRETLNLPSESVPQALALLGYPLDRGRTRDRRPFHQVVEFR